MSEKIETIKDEVKGYAIIESVANSEGGRKIIESLKKDALSAINELCFKYKEANHIDLIASCAKLSERMTLLRVFGRASKNKKITLDELEEVLKEDL